LKSIKDASYLIAVLINKYLTFQASQPISRHSEISL